MFSNYYYKNALSTNRRRNNFRKDQAKGNNIIIIIIIINIIIILFLFFINIFQANCYLQVRSKTKKKLSKPIYNSFPLKKETSTCKLLKEKPLLLKKKIYIYMQIISVRKKKQTN